MPENNTDAFVLSQLKENPTIKLEEQLQKMLFANFYKLCSIDESLNNTLKIFKNKNSIENILKVIISVQKIFTNANEVVDETQKRLLKEKFSIERKNLEKILNQLQIKNDEEKILRDHIFDNIRSLNKKIIISTSFDDQRVNFATEFTKKEDGVNPGCTITNKEGMRYTIKQGSTLGHTLSEVFSSMALAEIVQAFDIADASLPLIAKAFLVVKKSNSTYATIETQCKTALYAASEWSNDKISFKACELFGLKNRITAAGTRQAEDFDDLRKLNEACDLGLETIAIPTALIVDFDLHTENFLLKINDTHVNDIYRNQFDFHIKLLEQEMKKSNGITRADRMIYLKGIIMTLKDLGARVFFHKIDHDNGFYRYTDPTRKVTLSSHRTSPVHRVGIFFKTQPTLHLMEVTGGTKEGMDQLLLSDHGIERLLKINLDEQQVMVSRILDAFLKQIREKSIVIAGQDHANHAEFYLLNEFYYHIAEMSMPMPKDVKDVDLNQLKQCILEKLKLGTKFKVKDLYQQIYERLLEKEKTNTLSAKQDLLKAFIEKQNYLKSTQIIKFYLR